MQKASIFTTGCLDPLYVAEAHVSVCEFIHKEKRTIERKEKVNKLLLAKEKPDGEEEKRNG